MYMFKAMHISTGEPPVPPLPDPNNPIPKPPPTDIPPADDDPEGIPGRNPKDDGPIPGAHEGPIRDPEEYEPPNKIGWQSNGKELVKAERALVLNSAMLLVT